MTTTDTHGYFANGLGSSISRKIKLSYDDLLEFITNNNEQQKGTYEWIMSPTQPVRIYIDIDAKDIEQFNLALSLVKETFIDIGFNIAKHTSDIKISAHLISNTHYSTMEKLKPILDNLHKQNQSIDNKVYSKGTQKFRLPLSIKKEDDLRCLSIEDNTEIQDYILSNTTGLIEYIPIELPKKTKIIKQKKDTSNDKDTLIELLKRVPSDKWGLSYGEKPINWHNLKQVIYNILPNDEGFNLLDTYSQDHDKYNVENNKTIWQSTQVDTKFYNLKWLNKELAISYDHNDIANKYCDIYGDNTIIQVDKEGNITYYIWDNKYWHKNNIGLIKSYIIAICEEINIETNIKKPISIAKVNSIFGLLSAKPQLNIKDIPWDENGLILPFKNVVYDLTTGETRPHLKSDYITLTTGYDYIPSTIQQQNEIREYTLNKIFSNNPDGLHLSLQEYATGLIGMNIQHLFIHSGCGSNGKGVMSRLMSAVLGSNFYIQGKSKVLQEEDKCSSNPDKVNLAYKRYAVFPECEGKLNIAVIKDLFGGDPIKARDHCKSKTTHTNHLTGVIETNNAPKVSRVDEAVSRRFIMNPYKSSFSGKYLEDDYEKNIFKGSVMDTNFNDTYKIAFFDILAPIAKELIRNKFKIDIPISIQNITNSYFNSCNILTEYIETHIRPCDNPCDNEWVKVSDIIARFKSTDDFENMNKNVQTKINNKELIIILKAHPIYKLAFIERTKKQGKTIRSILMNYTWKETTDSEDEDNNEPIIKKSGLVCLLDSDTDKSQQDTNSIEYDSDAPPIPINNIKKRYDISKVIPVDILC